MEGGGGETCETFDLFLFLFTYYNLIKTVIFSFFSTYPVNINIESINIEYQSFRLFFPIILHYFTITIELILLTFDCFLLPYTLMFTNVLDNIFL